SCVGMAKHDSTGAMLRCTRQIAARARQAIWLKNQRFSRGGIVAKYVTEGKEFTRDMNYIPDCITAQPGVSADPLDATAREGKIDVTTWAVEAGRYRRIAADACAWAESSGS